MHICTLLRCGLIKLFGATDYPQRKLRNLLSRNGQTAVVAPGHNFSSIYQLNLSQERNNTKKKNIFICMKTSGRILQNLGAKFSLKSTKPIH